MVVGYVCYLCEVVAVFVHADVVEDFYQTAEMGHFASPLRVVYYFEEGEEQGVLVSVLLQLEIEFLDGLVPVQNMAY